MILLKVVRTMHAIYVRVSTEDQARHGYSIDFQIAACRDRLAELDIKENIEEFIDDGYSGEFLDRPELDRLRDFIHSGVVETVIIYDPDRMSRNLTNQLVLADEIEKANIKLMFVTGDYDVSPEGRLFFSMKGAVAAYEKAKIRERTTRGRRQKAAAGKIVQNARPYGYSWDKDNSMYTIDDAQAKVVRIIYDLLLTKEMGCRVIALELKTLGIIGPKGKPLSATTVHKVVSREMYCGTHYLFRQRIKKIGPKKAEITNLPPDEWIPIQIPPIVTREEWEQAQLQLKRNQKMSKRNTHHEYLLRGLLFCTLCGRSLMPGTRPAKRKTSAPKLYSYYTCITIESGSYATTGERCQCMRIPVEKFDDQIWSIFISIAKSEKTFTDFIRRKDFPDHSAKIAELTNIITEYINRHSQIARFIREGLLDPAAAESELHTISRQLATAKSNLFALKAAQEQLTKLKQKTIISEEIFSASTLEEKRNIIARSGFKIYAIRREENHIEFYFE
ncbi:MAG: Resolvase protein [Firmicutes bacterium]|nr:Resolvase protein [Bacillota bacterium]